jgi:hypothetical protein
MASFATGMPVTRRRIMSVTRTKSCLHGVVGRLLLSTIGDNPRVDNGVRRHLSTPGLTDVHNPRPLVFRGVVESEGWNDATGDKKIAVGTRNGHRTALSRDPWVTPDRVTVSPESGPETTAILTACPRSRASGVDLRPGCPCAVAPLRPRGDPEARGGSPADPRGATIAGDGRSRSVAESGAARDGVGCAAASRRTRPPRRPRRSTPRPRPRPRPRQPAPRPRPRPPVDEALVDPSSPGPRGARRRRRDARASERGDQPRSTTRHA